MRCHLFIDLGQRRRWQLFELCQRQQTRLAEDGRPVIRVRQLGPSVEVSTLRIEWIMASDDVIYIVPEG